MPFPTHRPRRLRSNPVFRRMMREHRVTVDDLVQPLFVVPGSKIKAEIGSLPGQYHLSVDLLVEECKTLAGKGIPAVILFGIPESKDDVGSGAYEETGIVQTAIQAIKKSVEGLAVIGDVCLCEYTDHGHCGVIKDGKVDNDATLDLLTEVAVSQAEAGADMVAPSDMMDGRVEAIRMALDEAGFENLPIMSYAVKHASAFYGPFREAAGSAPHFGDRKGYQMDPANGREAMMEADLDVDEGADILLVKPGMPCLDIISNVRSQFDLPVAVYAVSGEYAMIEAAAEKGWIDREKIVMETMTAFKRAGADIIVSYHAGQIAEWISEAK